ncbi:cadmium resistance transporter [Geminocystis sp. NIES-3708]|uniref:cadmium resistance transporter n=1 Tax=Geminocystis sp. NIES-3708 TaxID=1615909 RepID=UPI0005FC6C95|nr:cadmium resistance transporter [Geminocystis sp. NIES-3708]BAQ62473.1 cadmium resistance transporter [Geminocystis sp. NIES-3708]
MNQVFIAIITGITAFIATNIDDLVILLILFAQVKEEKITKIHVISGSYWGFIVIILLSLIGFFGGLIISPSWIGLLGILPIIIGIKQLIQPDNETEEVQLVTSEYVNLSNRHPFLSFVSQILHPQTYKVAVITFANGGDNIGVYVPLFATNNLMNLMIILLVFFVLKAISCYLAYRLIKNPKIADIITKYGNNIVPYILIGLGFFIFWKNGTFSLLYKG